MKIGKNFRKNSQDLHNNSTIFLENSKQKLQTQAKNSRCRQNQKRGLPKMGRIKKADLDAFLKAILIGQLMM